MPWREAVLTVAIRGLTLAGDQSRNSGQADAKKQLADGILRKGRSGFATIAALSWRVFLRVASECPPLCLEWAGEDLRSGDRLEENAVIGSVPENVAMNLLKRELLFNRNQNSGH